MKTLLRMRDPLEAILLVLVLGGVYWFDSISLSQSEATTRATARNSRAKTKVGESAKPASSLLDFDRTPFPSQDEPPPPLEVKPAFAGDTKEVSRQEAPLKLIALVRDPDANVCEETRLALVASAGQEYDFESRLGESVQVQDEAFALWTKWSKREQLVPRFEQLDEDTAARRTPIARTG